MASPEPGLWFYILWIVNVENYTLRYSSVCASLHFVVSVVAALCCSSALFSCHLPATKCMVQLVEYTTTVFLLVALLCSFVAA